MPVDRECVGLEDRDWYREESSEAYWRELNRSIGGSARSKPRGQRAGVGLLGAVGVSLVLTLVANHAGILRLDLHGSSASRSAFAPARSGLLAPAPKILLGTEPGFDDPRGAGQHWCLTVRTGQRYCATTGQTETGRDALTRVLREDGYAVVNAPPPSNPA